MANVTYGDQTGLDGTILSEAFQHQFRNSSVARIALQGQGVIKDCGGLGRSVTFNAFSGLDAGTTALTPGADFTLTTPSGATASASALPYQRSVRVDGLTASATPGDIIDSFREDLVGWSGEQFDLLALTALTGGTKVIVTQGTVAELAAGNVITTAEIRKAVAALEAGKAPKILGPNGPGYVGFIHPHVKYDLFAESSGELKVGLQNVNAPEWQAYSLGFALGVYWFETASAALVSADAGAGAVDVYYSPIVGARALGMAFCPVEEVPGIMDVDVFGNRSIVCRSVRPLTNGGYYADVHAIAQLGFGRINDASCRVIASSSSLGTNT